MFESARVKLTLMYLGIIMLISSIFSLVIYQMITSEIERRISTIQRRVAISDTFFTRELAGAKSAVFFRLIYANGVIFVASGVAGYFLAGKTLQPIEKAMEEQRRFVGDASHELRTPLTALRTLIEVTLRSKKLTIAESKKTLRSSLEDVELLEKLTGRLLALSQTQDDNVVTERLEISKIVRRVVKSTKPLANSKKIKIELKLKSVDFYGEEGNIEKLLTALIDNAIKYTPSKGKVEIRTQKLRRLVLISVIDNGIGISKTDMPHIFDRFYRAEPSRSRQRVHGFGLGLALAQQIVERHRGTIEVKSINGKGSEFIVKIPRSSSF